MSSKRRIRRQSERKVKEQAEKIKLYGGLEPINNNNQTLFGGIGRTSVADMILQKTSLLREEKPQIQIVTPETSLPIITHQASPTSPVGKITNEIVNEEQRRHKEIYQQARTNQEYYLFACNGKDRPWFSFPRHQHQYSEYILVTGPMAKICLANIWSEDEGNRHLDRATIDKYKRDMLNGAWIPTDEAIGIDYSGKIYNGRHRLTAIAEIFDELGDIEIPLYFTFNVLSTARFVIDSGRVRALNDRLKLILPPKLANPRIAGFCRALMRGVSKKHIRYSESEVASFAFKWESAIEWMQNNIPGVRAEVQAVITKAYLWYGPEKIEPFCYRIRHIHFSEEGDPARVLFVNLKKMSTQRIHGQGISYRKTLGAINALITNRKIEKLFEREEDIFEWEPGWEMPKKKN